MVITAVIYDHITCLAILAISVTIFIIMYPYFDKTTLIWPYLPLFGNICLCLPYKVVSIPVDHIYPYCDYVPTLCVLILTPCAKL